MHPLFICYQREQWQKPILRRLQVRSMAMQVTFIILLHSWVDYVLSIGNDLGVFYIDSWYNVKSKLSNGLQVKFCGLRCTRVHNLCLLIKWTCICSLFGWIIPITSEISGNLLGHYLTFLIYSNSFILHKSQLNDIHVIIHFGGKRCPSMYIFFSFPYSHSDWTHPSKIYNMSHVLRFCVALTCCTSGEWLYLYLGGCLHILISLGILLWLSLTGVGHYLGS